MAKEQIPSIHICTPEEIEGQRTACRLASELLDYITPYVEPGISTLELDNLIHRYTGRCPEMPPGGPWVSER